MNKIRSLLVVTILMSGMVVGSGALPPSPELRLQQPTTPDGPTAKPAAPQTDAKNSGAHDSGPHYSGMYGFRKEGEFVQLTVEDTGHVTGFVSRFGDGESDRGAFLDQFFKTGSLDGNKLSFTTEIVHGVSFDFRGTVERGEGKNPGDEAYFVLKGTLTENSSDVNKKVTSQTREVAFKMFPQGAARAPAARN